MMFTLKNDKLEITLKVRGAELVRVARVKDGADYLWDGNPEYWGRTSPVLFPIVGAVANDTYFVDGKAFQLEQHGFARDMVFDVVDMENNMIWFRLESSMETRQKYPFDFQLRIGYILDEETVTVKWEVENTGKGMMPFSIGAHPAFVMGSDLSNYSLQLKDNKGIETYVFDKARGLVDGTADKVTVVEDLPFLPLNKDLFETYPTLIFEDESEILLRAYMHDREVKVSFDGFPYVGIWSPINAADQVAPFVCIEPWYGMADTKPESGELAEKKGIQLLEAGEKFSASYTMTFS